MKRKEITIPNRRDVSDIDTADLSSEVDAYVSGYIDALNAVLDRMRPKVNVYADVVRRPFFNLNLEYVDLFDEIRHAIKAEES